MRDSEGAHGYRPSAGGRFTPRLMSPGVRLRAHDGPGHEGLEGTTRRRDGLWPSLDEENLLAGALLPPADAAASLARIASSEPLDEPDFPSLTIYPLLFRNLERHHQDRDLRSRLRGPYRWSWHRNQLLLAAVKPVLATLREAGIAALTIKGLPLALDTYRDLGARVMGDADLVVSRADARRAAGILTEIGWRPVRPVDDRALWALNGVDFVDGGGRRIDLQWTILPDNWDPDLDRPIWDAAEPVDLGGELVRRPEPGDHLLLIVCHGLSWAAGTPVHWVADAVTLLAERGEQIDWDRFIRRASFSRRALLTARGLGYLCSRFSAPVPHAVLRELQAAPIDRRERAAVWLTAHSGPSAPWGRAPLVLASYARSERTRGRRPGPRGFLTFVATRAGCTPRRWLVLACREAAGRLRVTVAAAQRRLVPAGVRR